MPFRNKGKKARLSNAEIIAGRTAALSGQPPHKQMRDAIRKGIHALLPVRTAAAQPASPHKRVCEEAPDVSVPGYFPRTSIAPPAFAAP